MRTPLLPHRFRLFADRVTHELDRRANLWVVLAVAFVAALTLFPTAGKPPFEPWCLTCGESFVVDAVLNVVLFLPLGFALGRKHARWWIAAVAGFALSACVELSQSWIPGRDPSVRDLLCNTLGAAAGWWLAGHMHGLIVPTRKRARSLAITAALFWLALHAFGDWLGLPSLPEEPYGIGYIGRRSDFEIFPGRVLGVTINGVEITRESVAEFERNIRSGWYDRGVVNVTSRVIPASEETRKLAPIVGVADSHHRQIFLVGQLGSTLVLRLRSHANLARLRGYLFELDRAFPGRPGAIGVAGDSLVVETERRRGEIRLVARTSIREHVSVRRLGPALVWTNFLFFDLPIGPATDVGTVLWLFLTLLPIGYWSAAAVDRSKSSARRLVAPTLLALIPVLALGVFAALFTLSPAPVREWTAAVAGLAFGWWLRTHRGAAESANSLLREERPKNNSLLSRRPRG